MSMGMNGMSDMSMQQMQFARQQHYMQQRAQQHGYDGMMYPSSNPMMYPQHQPAGDLGELCGYNGTDGQRMYAFRSAALL